MLIHALTFNTRHIAYNVAGVAHGERERGCFVVGHTFKTNCHKQRGRLIVRNAAVAISVDEKANFFVR